MGYGADALYSEMARESLPYWKQLSDTASAPIFHNSGVLWFAPQGEVYTAQSLAWLQANRVGHEHGDVSWLQRSEEHTSELQSLMPISYAVCCLKKTKKTYRTHARL